MFNGVIKMFVARLFKGVAVLVLWFVLVLAGYDDE